MINFGDDAVLFWERRYSYQRIQNIFTRNTWYGDANRLAMEMRRHREQHVSSKLGIDNDWANSHKLAAYCELILINKVGFTDTGPFDCQQNVTFSKRSFQDILPSR